jgi:hypothetical protein
MCAVKNGRFCAGGVPDRCRRWGEGCCLLLLLLFAVVLPPLGRPLPPLRSDAAAVTQAKGFVAAAGRAAAAAAAACDEGCDDEGVFVGGSARSSSSRIILSFTPMTDGIVKPKVRSRFVCLLYRTPLKSRRTGILFRAELVHAAFLSFFWFLLLSKQSAT